MCFYNGNDFIINQSPDGNEGTQAWLVFVVYPVLSYPCSWKVVGLDMGCLPVCREIDIEV